MAWDGTEKRAPSQDILLLSERLQSLHGDVNEIKSALRSLTEAITKLALIEERQAVFNATINRAFDAIGKVETALGKIDDRLKALEVQQPVNNQTTHWVITAIGVTLAGVGAWFFKGHP